MEASDMRATIERLRELGSDLERCVNDYRLNPSDHVAQGRMHNARYWRDKYFDEHATEVLNFASERLDAMESGPLERKVVEAVLKWRSAEKTWHTMPGMTPAEVGAWKRQQSVVGGCYRDLYNAIDALESRPAPEPRA